MHNDIKILNEASEFIKNKIENRKPKIGIVLGSGLGMFAEKLENKLVISYNDIPHFHQTTVVGHKGNLIIGEINGVEIAAFQGRFHAYEGHDQATVVLPVRILSQIGVETLILTNASGGINSNYKPGDLVALTDHINMTGKSPLTGPNHEELGPRFPDMSDTYKVELTKILEDCAQEMGITLHKGVYAGVMGPAYETPAEIRMLKTIGSDMVGMSTVPEAIAANHAGLKVCAVSCITNYAAGISEEKLSHDDVKDVANMAMEKFTKLLQAAVCKF